MEKSKVEEYLQQGIHGPKETNPDERRKYLGTLRERIEVALTQGQVMEEEIYSDVEQEMKEHPQTHLYLNGQIDYRFLSKYIQKANQYKIEFTIVTNKEHQTDIGLILAHSNAVDKENIFVTRKPAVPEVQEEKKGVFSFFKKLIP
ncbi:YueI family protein [Bacillus tuaregi]|uniref:YueI family protein n=1 Tax=Bacillus tuaregi TaxID=1816695 RepID=UPI0008F883CB|nr:YueI family protein [Bacillus tuaregi]